MISNKKKTDDLLEEDPITEIRRIRDKHAKKFNYDLAAIVADLRKFEKSNKIKTIVLASKK